MRLAGGKKEKAEFLGEKRGVGFWPERKVAIGVWDSVLSTSKNSILSTTEDW
jgi:hypothetical protein